MDNNLKKLRMMKNLTQEQLAEELNLSLSTIKKYEGDRQIPIEQALEISNKFDVTLDWLYCKKDIINERDTLVEVLQSLNKVFKMTTRETHNGDDVVLLVDSKFRDFLQEINDIYIASMYFNYQEKEKEDPIINDLRKRIFEKYEPILKKIFEEVYFDEEHACEVHDINDTKLLDVLE
ncbi:helix-turn-helix domain-containing protein [Facklamia sp. P12932]|uniref:helix-turn-helix domain-containing protein n=1 Tax=Facklamia sp. P12932 TaxID=3421947 RepID=UPI003D170400